MRTFIGPSMQAVIGRQELPQEVVNGPRYLILWGRRIFKQFSTVPQWLSFTSSEKFTANQVPVILQIDCNWSRNLTGLTREQLYNAIGITNKELELTLRKYLEAVANHYIKNYRANDLLATPDAEDQQFIRIKRNQRRLEQCLSDEIKKQFGCLGLIINMLYINITLPDRLQQEIEETWRVQQHQRHVESLTKIKIASAIAESRPNVRLFITETYNNNANNYQKFEEDIVMKPLYGYQINGSGGNQKSKGRSKPREK